MEPICDKLKSNTTMKCIDFTMNHITTEGLKLLKEALRENTGLELLGLGSMKFTIKDLEPILMEFGKVQITEEEAKNIEEEAKAKAQKVKEAATAKGKKGAQKGAEAPLASTIEHDENNNYYDNRKDKFKHLNIGLNNLTIDS